MIPNGLFRMKLMFQQYQKMNFSWSRFPNVKLPLIQDFHSVWPEPRPTTEFIEAIPPRTVPENILRFSMRATFDKGMAIFYPHLKFNPADLKVHLKVSNIQDLCC